MLVDDDVVGDVQAQACAGTGGFGGKEGLEDTRLSFGWNPWPIVDDLDYDVALFATGEQPEFSLTLHGLDGVVDDVGPDLIQFGPVGLDTRNVVGVVARDADACFDLGAQEHQGCLQALSYVDLWDRRLIQVRVRFDGLDDLGDRFSALSQFL